MKIKEFVTTWAFVGSIISVALFYLIDGHEHFTSRAFNWPDIPLHVVWAGALTLWGFSIAIFGGLRRAIGMLVLGGVMLSLPGLAVSLQEGVNLLSYSVYTEKTVKATIITATICIVIALIFDVADWWDHLGTKNPESAAEDSVKH